VLARAIHSNSESRTGPFIKVNCGAIPSSLLESELFGYEKGAFTNASRTGKSGIFEIAKGGTLFLDEIGEIPLALQAKLLGVLQDMKFSRVGGIKQIELDARVIAATNRDLEEMIKHGQFRKDLFYRINVVNLKIPPLAERTEDIYPLASHFLKKVNDKYKTANTFSSQIIRAFIEYIWPGNVRQMEHLIERLVVLAPNEQLTREMLPDNIMGHTDTSFAAPGPGGGDLKELLADVERRILQTFVNRGKSGNQIARELGINQSTVVRKLKKLGIRRKA
jgi:transcriptional regulator with PAS, ATPase and Fis domain